MSSMDINPQTSVESIVEKYPDSIKVFQKYNINIIICGQIVWDSLEDICKKNGVDVNIIIKEIKDLISR